MWAFRYIVIVLCLCLCPLSAQADWDKDLPSGSKAANLLDDDVRANNTALETAMDEEHVFTTGSDQTGKHTFAVEDETTRDADTDYAAGSVSITTDTVSGEYVYTFTHNGSTWHTPLDAFLNNANDWVKGQYVTPTALTPAASITSALANGNVFTVTLDQNSTLANPTDIASYSGKSGVWYYIITNDSTPRTLIYGSSFTVDGINTSTGPTINSTANSETVIMAVLDASGNLQVSRALSAASDAVAQAGSSANFAVTPANLGSYYDDTAAAGYFEIIGTGLLFQWIRDSDCDPGDDFDFATAFPDTNYSAVLTLHATSGIDQQALTIVDADTVTVRASSPNHPCSIIAIGQKP